MASSTGVPHSIPELNERSDATGTDDRPNHDGTFSRLIAGFERVVVTGLIVLMMIVIALSLVELGWRVVDTYWRFSDGGSKPWSALQPKLTNTVDALYVADVDGDNRDDIILMKPGHVWMFSLSGLSDLLPITTTPYALAAAGRFSGAGASELLFWDANGLAAARFDVRGATPTTQFSRQDMR